MEKLSHIFGGINSQCKIHKKEGFIFASLIANDHNPFYCSTCAVKRHKNTNLFVSISDILSSDQDEQPIQNWPPEIDEDDIQFLTEKKQTDQIKDQLRQGIMEFYDNLSNQINSAINESKKEQLNELEIHFGSVNLIDLYNKLFKRKELVRIFENFNEQSQDEYNKLLEQLNETSENDLEVLSECIDEKKEEEIKFRKFQDNSIKTLSKKFTTLLNDLSLSLFKQDEECITEKYDFTMINQELVEKIKEKKQQNQINKPDLLQEKQFFFMFDQKYNLHINYWSNQITEVKNNKQEDCSCFDQWIVDQGSIYSFKVKFQNETSFHNFGIGFLVSDRNSKGEKLLYRDFWQRVIRTTKNQSSYDLVFSFTLNLREKLLKVDSYDLDSEQIQVLNNFNSQFNYRILFDMSKYCEGFQIIEFSEK